MTQFGFEARYQIVAPITLALMLQFAALIWLRDRLPKLAQIPVYPLAAAFLVQDFLYQITVAWFLFGERPRDLLLTGRIKRMGDDWRAQRFKRVLNEIDPGHV